MKKWMGLFLVVMMVLTSVMALAEAPYQNKGGHGPYNAGILPEVKEEILSGNKAYQDAFNARYQAGIAFRAKMRAGGIKEFDLKALLDSFEVNRDNFGFSYQSLFPVKNGISTASGSGGSVAYIMVNNKTASFGTVVVNNKSVSVNVIPVNNTNKTVDWIR